MLKEHEQMIEKTIETSTFLNGGTLNPKQQDTFIALVRKYSTLLPQVRFHRLTQPVEDIDKMHVGEPVTEAAEENTPSSNQARARFNKVTLTARKLRSQWHVTTEALQGNIEQDRLEDTLMNAFTERMATDFEMLAIQGDSTLAGSDPTSRLLKRCDGWYKQAKSAHVLDAGGVTVTKGLLAFAKRMMPKQFRNDPGLRWIMSDSVVIDWEDSLSDRETDLGDRVLGGGSAGAPLGIPILPVPLIPDDLSVSTGDATSAINVATLEQGPYVFTASNNVLKLDIDNAGAVTVTITAGTLETVVVANLINAAYVTAHGAAYRNIAADDGFGHLILKSPTTGAASEVEIQTVANQAAVTLGFDVSGGYPVTKNGAAAGANSVLEGSFIMLCNPRNLIFGMLDGTRVFTEFDKNNDRIETTMYNQVDAKIENLDSIVLIQNLRLADLLA